MVSRKELSAYNKARAHYEEAVKINPHLYHAHSNLARVLRDHFKEVELAENHSAIALKLKSDATSSSIDLR